ncbi:MAG: hypothetical protein U1E65_02975 [Myxococcota bacterium]
MLNQLLFVLITATGGELTSTATVSQMSPDPTPVTEAAPSPALVVEPPPAPAASPSPSPAPTGPGGIALLAKWKASLYGFVELDSMWDTTQSFNDTAGGGLIARPDTYAGSHGRATFAVRNSRIGFKLAAPEFEGIKASAVLEMDFLGNQPPGISEAALFTNPGFRVRHFNLKLETEIVDILIGQSWQLFGWQPYFHTNSLEIQGVLAQVYGRTPQIRLSHMFKGEAVSLDVGIAAMRPAQRNSAVPDGQAGLRLLINGLTGWRTGGSTGGSLDAAAIGFSGLVRRFAAAEFSASPKNTADALGWGLSLDLMVPIIPASKESHGNALTLMASGVKGEGINDQYSAFTGGVGFPALPNPMNLSPAPTYTPDLDNGLASFDSNGKLHPIEWHSLIVGLQYYFPGSGAVWLAANYSRIGSTNAQDFGAAAKVITDGQRVDGNIFWDLTSAVRLGATYVWLNQKYADGHEATNHRVQLSGFFLF